MLHIVKTRSAAGHTTFAAMATINGASQKGVTSRFS
jgi:hypothetical protein